MPLVLATRQHRYGNAVQLAQYFERVNLPAKLRDIDSDRLDYKLNNKNIRVFSEGLDNARDNVALDNAGNIVCYTHTHVLSILLVGTLLAQHYVNVAACVAI